MIYVHLTYFNISRNQTWSLIASKGMTSFSFFMFAASLPLRSRSAKN